MSIIGASLKAEKIISLTWVFEIYFLMQFQNNKGKMIFLINFDSEVNIITPFYIKQLYVQAWKRNIKAQKTGVLLLEILAMVIANF